MPRCVQRYQHPWLALPPSGNRTSPHSTTTREIRQTRNGGPPLLDLSHFRAAEDHISKLWGQGPLDMTNHIQQIGRWGRELLEADALRAQLGWWEAREEGI